MYFIKSILISTNHNKLPYNYEGGNTKQQKVNTFKLAKPNSFFSSDRVFLDHAQLIRQGNYRQRYAQHSLRQARFINNLDKIAVNIILHVIV